MSQVGVVVKHNNLFPEESKSCNLEPHGQMVMADPCQALHGDKCLFVQEIG